MPKRTDIKSILIIGSGPIVIGQACEFDYSGTQACKALKEEGFRVILVNSNPATIMTDPATADKTYIEPLTTEVLERIIEIEKPEAVLPTLGGQTGLNLALKCARLGIFEKHGVEMLGANEESIHRAEDREAFKNVIDSIGLKQAKSDTASTLEEALDIADKIGYPCVVRPAFTLGGTGGGIAKTKEELIHIAKGGLSESLVTSILVEESIYGWKEYELEVMRDTKDNVVIICSIENLDPVGVHTGDSITIAPAQTLTDVEYQEMRDASLKIIRAIGVETGGSNIQFAQNPKNGDLIVIEMNPRVSRSSALASKATGFPIAKFAAKLAVGYTLDELQNDITQKTPACFEPTLDYCVVKIPRFNFKKFPKSSPVLGTAMKAVGEVMAIGRTFKEALNKGIRSLELNRFGLSDDHKELKDIDPEELKFFVRNATPWRLYYVYYALKHGIYTLEEVFNETKIDRWYLHQIQQILEFSKEVDRTPESLRRAKELGFSDVQLASLLNAESELEIRDLRKQLGITPTYSLVDTCAAEFEAETPYYYSTYETECEANPTQNKKVMILGGGPNRIGQGIEFDYCCVHASLALRELGVESIMVNSNPETVSTDFDISDKLYFEPLTFEDVLNIYEKEQPDGVIIQFGGQTPLNLSQRLKSAGVKILGTSPDTIDLAEDRELFQTLLNKLNLKQPANGIAVSAEEAIEIAKRIDYPVVVRPSYVLGGASMRIVYSDEEVTEYMGSAIEASPDRPILIDKYLERAIEIDVDGLSDGKECLVAGIMEHIEEAGVHSGDSACVIPPHSISEPLIEQIEKATKALAIELGVIGLLNIQFAIKNDELYVLEVNPRGSRTVPFVSKATGLSWANLATRVVMGHSIESLNIKQPKLDYYAIKEAVLPFNKFPDVDILLSPEMKSTGEAMGIDKTFELAFYKSQLSAGQKLPESGNVFLSVGDRDKPYILDTAKQLNSLGFSIIATEGTAAFLKENNIEAKAISKISENPDNSVLTHIQSDEIDLAFNTASSQQSIQDEIIIRQEILLRHVPYVTTIPGMIESVKAIAAIKTGTYSIKAIQEYHNV